MTVPPCENCTQCHKCKQAYIAYTMCPLYHNWYAEQWEHIRKKASKVLNINKQLIMAGVNSYITHI